MKHLYHGTTSRALRSIFKHGLKPRGEKGSAWEAASRHDHVYLTSAYAIHFGKNVVGGEDRKGAPSHAAVIRVDVDKLDTSKLYADEDALEQYNRQNDRVTMRWMTMLERTAYYRDNWQTLEVARKWESSLGVLGNCSHFGVIPSDAISAVALVKRGAPLWHASDPQITIQNFRLLAPFYKMTCGFPFEGADAVGRELADADDLQRGICERYCEGFSKEGVRAGLAVMERPAEGWRVYDAQRILSLMT